MTSQARDVASHRLATLVVAATAVLVAATDTYVVVLALPDMMAGVGLGIDELQKAAPIVTVFLLGYVAMLPLLGKLSDFYGRVPLLLVLIAVFTVGSVLTAIATDLSAMIAGRFLQGVGGGGLVPVTLAFVADRWDERRRGVPLGAVGAVQELGAVLGPLLGAAVLALADWRAIFWLNAAAGLVLAVVLRTVSGTERDGGGTDDETGPGRRRMLDRVRSDPFGTMLLVALVVLLGAALVRPAAWRSDVTWGWLVVPTIDEDLPGAVLSSPVWLLALLAAVAFVMWEVRVARPLVDLPEVWRGLVRADVVGGLLIAASLGAVIAMFATADPSEQVLSDSWPTWLGVSLVATAGLVWRQRRAAAPLVPRGSLSARQAWGALAVSFFLGAALVIVLVDVPVFSRTVAGGGSQWEAAALLLRFLVGLPIGALVGGLLLRRFPPAPLSVLGLGAAAAGLLAMSGWDASSVAGPGDDVVLLVTGLGFGVAVAPVNAALLAVVDAGVHGLGSAMLVVFRMVGMLVGLSALTAIGLRRLSDAVESLPPPTDLCPDRPLACPEFAELLGETALTQVQTTFLGAALCAATAAVLSLVLLRRPASA
jgi:MFS family permease